MDVNSPSPLVGEGRVVLQQARLGEGAANGAIPSPIFSVLQCFLALSHKGRGRRNAHLACGYLHPLLANSASPLTISALQTSRRNARSLNPVCTRLPR